MGALSSGALTRSSWGPAACTTTWSFAKWSPTAGMAGNCGRTLRCEAPGRRTRGRGFSSRAGRRGATFGAMRAFPIRRRIFLGTALLLAGCGGRAGAPGSSRYDDLVTLFAEWRTFQQPKLLDGVPDYSAGAMRAQRRELAHYQTRLAAIEPNSRAPAPP